MCHIKNLRLVSPTNYNVRQPTPYRVKLSAAKKQKPLKEKAIFSNVNVNNTLKTSSDRQRVLTNDDSNIAGTNSFILLFYDL